MFLLFQCPQSLLFIDITLVVTGIGTYLVLSSVTMLVLTLTLTWNLTKFSWYSNFDRYCYWIYYCYCVEIFLVLICVTLYSQNLNLLVVSLQQIIKWLQRHITCPYFLYYFLNTFSSIDTFWMLLVKREHCPEASNLLKKSTCLIWRVFKNVKCLKLKEKRKFQCRLHINNRYLKLKLLFPI